MCKRLVFLVLLTLLLAGTVSAQGMPPVPPPLWGPERPSFFGPTPQTQRLREWQQQRRERSPVTYQQTCERDWLNRVTCRTTCS